MSRVPLTSIEHQPESIRECMARRGNVRVALRQFSGISIDDGLCGYPKPR